MKKTMIALVVTLVSVGASANIKRTILECKPTGNSAGAVYSITAVPETAAGGPDVVKIEAHTRTGKDLGSIEVANLIRYGSAVIATSRGTRSGYAHIYWNTAAADAPAVSVVDVNLFSPGASGFNTGGPRTDYICR